MEDTNQQRIDRFAPVSSPGDRAVELHNLTGQPLSPKDERIVSVNPSPDVAISGASRNAKDQPVASSASGALTTVYPSSYTPQEQSYYYGGYDNNNNNNNSNWDEHSNYVNANNLHVIPPAMYNDNSSLFYPPGYGYDSQMAYGQFSPLPSPLSPIMFDGQLFSPHQMSMTPPYYPPAVSPGPPHVTSSQTELMPSGSSSQENYTDKAVFGPGSGYYLPFGSFGGGDLSGNTGLGLYQYPSDYGSTESLQSRSSSLDTSRYMSPLPSGTVYPQPFGIHGSYEQNVTQSPFQGFGFTSNSARHFTHGGPYQSSFGSSSNRNRFTFDKSGRRVRDRDIVSNPTDALGLSTDRNRGPRASNPKSKSFTEEGSSSGIRDAEHTAGFHANHINSPDFVTECEQAKFFVIKSFSEDNIHKSIKYSVWASTPLGNRKLDAAYQESKEMEGICPVFLFFSVNGSGQFCGVAEMIGPVDFENNADYWQQDRWSGQFPVKWHIIKDVPNSCFRHILLENNDNKPVTHSRDSQEVKMELGIEMLKIFKNHDSETTLLDDFNFYDEREKSLLERKAKQRVSSTASPAATLATEPIGQLADNLADTLRLEGSNNISKTE